MNPNLIEVLIPLIEVQQNEHYFIFIVHGVIEDIEIGFNLFIAKTLRPFLTLSATSSEMIPCENSEWDPQGVIWESTGVPTVNFFNMMWQWNTGAIKDYVEFDTAFLYSSVQQDPLFPNNFEGTFTDPNATLFSLKIEHVVSHEPLVRCQLLLDIDLEQNVICVYEKDTEFREGLLQTFSI